MRKQVKNYRAYFNAKDRRLKISTQNKVPTTPAQLHMAVMAAICGLKDAQPNRILRSVFRAGLDLNNNVVYQDFVKYHADGAFWANVPVCVLEFLLGQYCSSDDEAVIEKGVQNVKRILADEYPEKFDRLL